MKAYEYEKWDLRMLSLAAVVSTWSKDPSTQVGAVIADRKNRIVSLGYNGLPRGIVDTSELLNDRETKYRLVRHAEENAILFSGRNDLSGCTCYTYPIPPCAGCASELLQANVSRVVSLEIADQGHQHRWGKDFELSEKVYMEVGIEFILYEVADLSSFLLANVRKAQ